MAITEVATQQFDQGNIQPAVSAEIKDLQGMGFDVEAVYVENPQALSAEEQRLADERIQQMEITVITQGSDAAFELFANPEVRPAMNVWSRLRMRAMALHTLYGANTFGTLGEGISSDAYSRPIFNGQSAVEVLNPAKKDQILGDYLDFLKTPIDDNSRNIFAGCKDSQGVNTRAVEAANLAVEHINEQGEAREDLVFASLACGAAGPVFQMSTELEKQGHGIKTIHMVDKDAMALASAYALADADKDVQERLSIHREDLINPDLTKYIEPGSVDVIDLLGLFEYFPSNIQETAAMLGCTPEQVPEDFTNPAANLLKAVREIVKPGGQIIFGNMLNERPQQIFFNDVVQWPRLFQRTISDVLGVIADAGYSIDSVKVRIPSGEGVYGVYAIEVPEDQPVLGVVG